MIFNIFASIHRKSCLNDCNHTGPHTLENSAGLIFFFDVLWNLYDSLTHPCIYICCTLQKHPSTYSCWSYCTMMRLMEQIAPRKTLGVLTLVLPTYHWYCRENPWPKQRSWMTKLLHRRTGFEKTTLKRGYFWIYSVYIYIYIYFFFGI